MISFAEPPERVESAQRSIVVQLESSIPQQSPVFHETHQDVSRLYAQLDARALAQTQRLSSMSTSIPGVPVAVSPVVVSSESNLGVCSAGPVFSGMAMESSSQRELTSNQSLEMKPAPSLVMVISSVPALDAAEQPHNTEEVGSSDMEVTRKPSPAESPISIKVLVPEDAEYALLVASESKASVGEEKSPVLVGPLPTNLSPIPLLKTEKQTIEVSESKSVEAVSMIASDREGILQLSQSVDQVSQSFEGLSDSMVADSNLPPKSKPSSSLPVEERPTVDLSLHIIHSYDSNQSSNVPDWNRQSQSVDDLSKSDVTVLESPLHKSDDYVVPIPVDEPNSSELGVTSPSKDIGETSQAKASPIATIEESKLLSFANSPVDLSVQSQDSDWIQVPTTSSSPHANKSPEASMSEKLDLPSHDIVSSVVFSDDSVSISQSLDVQQSVVRLHSDESSRQYDSSSVVFSDDSLSVSGLISPVKKDSTPKLETADVESKAVDVPIVVDEVCFALY